MNIGDKVRVRHQAFKGKEGVIVDRMLPDYEWAVQVDGMSSDALDAYGFDESELEVI